MDMFSNLIFHVSGATYRIHTFIQLVLLLVASSCVYHHELHQCVFYFCLWYNWLPELQRKFLVDHRIQVPEIQSIYLVDHRPEPAIYGDFSISFC